MRLPIFLALFSFLGNANGGERDELTRDLEAGLERVVTEDREERERERREEQRERVREKREERREAEARREEREEYDADADADGDGADVEGDDDVDVGEVEVEVTPISVTPENASSLALPLAEVSENGTPYPPPRPLPVPVQPGTVDPTHLPTPNSPTKSVNWKSKLRPKSKPDWKSKLENWTRARDGDVDGNKFQWVGAGVSGGRHSYNYSSHYAHGRTEKGKGKAPEPPSILIKSRPGEGGSWTHRVYAFLFPPRGVPTASPAASHDRAHVSGEKRNSGEGSRASGGTLVNDGDAEANPASSPDGRGRNDGDADSASGTIVNYRWTPILSGIVIPFSILLEIPGLTERWYIRTEGNKTVEIKKNSVLLDVGLAFSMACAVVANVAIVMRFFEYRVRAMTALAVVALSVHDIINTVAVTVFGIEHRFNDGFTYGQSFWFTVCSTIASVFTNMTLIWDFVRTPDFSRSGSGLTRTQRSLVVITIILLVWLALGALINSLLLSLTFIDGLYFTVVTIETVGFGDIVPTSTASRIFAAVHGTVGILNLALAVGLARETVVEGFEYGYRKRLGLWMQMVERGREKRRAKRRQRLVRRAVKRQLANAGLPMYADVRCLGGPLSGLGTSASAGTGAGGDPDHVHPHGTRVIGAGGGRGGAAMVVLSRKLRTLNLQALSREQVDAAMEEANRKMEEDEGRHGRRRRFSRAHGHAHARANTLPESAAGSEGEGAKGGRRGWKVPFRKGRVNELIGGSGAAPVGPTPGVIPTSTSNPHTGYSSNNATDSEPGGPSGSGATGYNYMNSLSFRRRPRELTVDSGDSIASAMGMVPSIHQWANAEAEHVFGGIVSPPPAYGSNSNSPNVMNGVNAGFARERDPSLSFANRARTLTYQSDFDGSEVDGPVSPSGTRRMGMGRGRNGTVHGIYPLGSLSMFSVDTLVSEDEHEASQHPPQTSSGFHQAIGGLWKEVKKLGDLGEGTEEERLEKLERLNRMDPSLVGTGITGSGTSSENGSEETLERVVEGEQKKDVNAKMYLVWIFFFTFWLIGAAIFHVTEGWSYGVALWFCFEAFSTIGYGDFTPTTPAGRSVFIVWAMVGVGTMTVLISVLSEAYSSRYKLAIKSERDDLSSTPSSRTGRRPHRSESAEKEPDSKTASNPMLLST